ncbi:MAG: hypothetical protein AB7M12_11325, partial [Hyphomonadaceae bacterium]
MTTQTVESGASGAPAPAPGVPFLPMSLLVASAIVGAIGNAGLQSVLPAIGRKVGIPDALIAGVFAVSSLMFVVTSPFWARISDRTGRKA